MDNRGIALKEIHGYLATFTQLVKQQNASGKLDINKDAENVAVNILNKVYGFDLKNANSTISSNYAAVDLVDTKNSVCVQVTSENDNTKIIETVQAFVDNAEYVKNYKKLYVYIITEKKSYYAPTIEKIKLITENIISFSIDENVIDNKILGNIIDNFSDIDKIFEIGTLLRKEFGIHRDNIPLLKEVNNSKKKFLFDYRNRLTDFVGREQELSDLDDFFYAEEDFLWWIITGRAGSGKSRLALEFVRKLKRENVEAGFFSTNHISSFDWNISSDRSMLIVIDYVQSEYQFVLELITRLKNKTNYSGKVRLLLIERAAAGEWWQNIVNNFYASSSLFKDETLEISLLQSDKLFDIVEAVFVKEGGDLDLDKETIISIVSQIDPLQRPLFAMFVGVALSKSQRVSDWNQYNLLDFLIEEDYRLTDSTFKEYNETTINKHRDLLAICTVCYGLSWYDLQSIFERNIEWLPSADEYDEELYSFISYGTVIEDHSRRGPIFLNSQDESKKGIVLSPIIPDILGEYYVLKRLSVSGRYKFRFTHRLKEFIEIAESTHFYNYSIFSRRILQDFPDHERVLDFLIGDKNSYTDNRGSSGHMVIESMKYLHYNNIEYLKILWGYTRTLAQTVNMRKDQFAFLDDPDRVYQEACQIMVLRNVGNLEQQKIFYDAIKFNTDKIEINPKEFVDSNSRYENFDFNEARRILRDGFSEGEAEEYISKRLIRDERIAHIEVIALKNIMMNDNSIEKNNVELYINRIFHLCVAFSDPRIKVDSLDILIDFGQDSIEDFDDKIKNLFNNIITTTNQPSPINVIGEQFNFVEKVVEYYIRNKNTYVAIGYVRQFMSHLLSQKPNSDIAYVLVSLSKFLGTVCKSYYELNVIFSGDVFYEEIIKIHHVFRGPVGLHNPINEILIRTKGYRNGKFD